MKLLDSVAAFIGAGILALCLIVFVVSIFYQFQNQINWTAFSIVFICGLGLLGMGLLASRNRRK